MASSREPADTDLVLFHARNAVESGGSDDWEGRRVGVLAAAAAAAARAGCKRGGGREGMCVLCIGVS